MDRCWIDQMAAETVTSCQETGHVFSIGEGGEEINLRIRSLTLPEVFFLSFEIQMQSHQSDQ